MNIMASTPIGRFAPSPTGALHFGSMVTAIACYLNAKSRGGRCLLRIDDGDTTRSRASISADIFQQLQRFGFVFDGATGFQSERQSLYQHALQTLKRVGRIYPCACTRREISDSSITRSGEMVYPGTCRHGLASGRESRLLRFLIGSQSLSYIDLVQGPQCEQLAEVSGDFVVRRADQLFAYQLMVVVDDGIDNISEVIRGTDLLDSTVRQMALQQALALPAPRYGHIPVACNEQGQKLSKQTLARTVADFPVAEVLFDGLRFLAQQPPASLQDSVSELWQWALQAWSIDQVPKERIIICPKKYYA